MSSLGHNKLKITSCQCLHGPCGGDIWIYYFDSHWRTIHNLYWIPSSSSSSSSSSVVVVAAMVMTMMMYFTSWWCEQNIWHHRHHRSLHQQVMPCHLDGLKPLLMPLDTMATILQTFSNAFSRIKSFVFWFKFHWGLLLRVHIGSDIGGGSNPALVQIMAWHRRDDKPLPEQMLIQFTDTYMQHYSQIINSNVFSWMKSFVFWFEFHWSLFLRVHLTIIQHWFR